MIKKVLLICPVFFNYENRIKNELERQGYKVVFWSDRASTNFFYKVFLRLFPYFTSKFSERYFNKKISKVNQFFFDNIIVIKGEGLSVQLLEKILLNIRHKNNYYYLWDSIKNTNYAVKKASLFKQVGTFDFEDSKNQNWIYRPLFASSVSNLETDNKNNKWDLCFAGTVHSDRLKIIQKIKNKIPTNLKFYCFAYIPSKIILFLKKCIFSTYRNFDKNELTTKSLPYEEILEKFNNSIAIIDIEHPSQRGLTMRSIEVLLANKKLITTNKSIINSDLFCSSRVLVIDRENPVVKLDFLNQPTLRLNSQISKKYTIECFVKNLCI